MEVEEIVSAEDIIVLAMVDSTGRKAGTGGEETADPTNEDGD